MTKRASTRAPASSSRKPRAKPASVIALVPPTHEEIARRAFELYVARGQSDGSEVGDWLQAESELAAAVPLGA
jgi:hypothetical protein